MFGRSFNHSLTSYFLKNIQFALSKISRKNQGFKNIYMEEKGKEKVVEILEGGDLKIGEKLISSTERPM